MRKNSIIILVLILICSLILTSTGFIFSQDIEKPEQLFKELRDSYSSKFPTDFIAEVQSELMGKELKDVPEFEKINPKESFKIVFIFIKEFGERLVVENACLLTRNKFQDYLEVYKSFRSFLDPSITLESFFSQYKWEMLEPNDKFYVVKMLTRGILNEYYKVYVSKEDLLVEQTLYYKDNKVIGRVDIKYGRYGKYFVPNIITGFTNVLNTENEYEKKDFDIKLINFKVNTGLTVDDILGDDDIDC